jgi:hypothetical protein
MPSAHDKADEAHYFLHVELTDFCVRSFGAVIEVLSAAHEWCGGRYNPKLTCNHSGGEYRTLRESMVFP